MSSRFLNRRKWAYLTQGIVRRLWHSKHCPCCGCVELRTIDRKFFHTLEQCSRCGILSRFPGDSSSQLIAFYQHDYAEPGLTTELPSQAELRRLKIGGFKDSGKDFSLVISLLQAVGIQHGDRVLDWGANWGYGTWQLRRAGFQAEGFEISKPRAQFATELGIVLATSPGEVHGPFDAVYSSHVLEHVDNPLAVIRYQLSITKPSGFVIAHTPNGSADRRRNDPVSFHSNWGQVHPFLLTDEFVTNNFRMFPLFVSSLDDPDVVRKWDRESQFLGSMFGAGLFFIIRNQPFSGIYGHKCA
jgi:hypothetical protein